MHQEHFERQPSFSRRQWQLIDAALRVLDRVGISGFTMRALADEIGQSPMAAYKHFENQRVLQLELWRACHNHFYDKLLEASQKHSDPAASFMALCRSFMMYALDFPFRYELLFNHPFIREIADVEGVDDQREAVWRFGLEVLQRAQTVGLFRDDIRSELLLAAAASQIRGLATTMIYAPIAAFGDLTHDELVDSGLAFVREALIAR